MTFVSINKALLNEIYFHIFPGCRRFDIRYNNGGKEKEEDSVVEICAQEEEERESVNCEIPGIDNNETAMNQPMYKSRNTQTFNNSDN